MNHRAQNHYDRGVTAKEIADPRRENAELRNLAGAWRTTLNAIATCENNIARSSLREHAAEALKLEKSND